MDVGRVTEDLGGIAAKSPNSAVIRSDLRNGRSFGVRVSTRIACQTSVTGRGTGRNIRFDPWSWLSLHRAQASGADRRRVCPATDDIPALA